MKKAVIAAIMVFSLCDFLRSTDVRMNGLGLMSYMVADDDTLMQIYPAQVTNYKNELEMSTISTTGYIIYAIGGNVLGLQCASYSGPVSAPQTQNNSLFPGLVNPAVIYAPAKSVNLFWGIKHDENSSLAFMLSYAGGGAENKNTILNPGSAVYAYDTKQNSYDISAAIGYSVKDFFDIGLQIGIPVINNTGYETYSLYSISNQPYANETMNTAFGFHSQINTRILFLPYIAAASIALGAEKTDDVQQLDYNGDGNYTDRRDISRDYSYIYGNFLFNIGLAANLQINPAVVVIPGINFNFSFLPPATNSSTSAGQSTTSLYLAIEDKINGFLTWRAGLNSCLLAFSLNNNVDNYSYFPGNFAIFNTAQSLNPSMVSGISINAAGLTIDSDITYGSGLKGNLAATLKF